MNAHINRIQGNRNLQILIQVNEMTCNAVDFNDEGTVHRELPECSYRLEERIAIAMVKDPKGQSRRDAISQAPVPKGRHKPSASPEGTP